MSVFSDIRTALESQIASVTGIPSAANRSWENVRFEPTTGTPWVRMTLLPGESRPAIRGENPVLSYLGLFQVDVFEPSGGGPRTADTLADAIRDQFSSGTDITVNTTTTRIRWSERLPGRLDPPWYMVPIQISWYTYV